MVLQNGAYVFGEMIMKKAILIITSLAVLFVGICALGGLADDKREDGQNILGGKGELKKVVNGHSVLLPPFCDDTNIYFDLQEFSPSGTVDHLYVKNIGSGDVQPVCSRPLCVHTTRECPLHFLYPRTFLEYFLLDGKLCFCEVNDDELDVYRCDVTTDKRTKLCSLPAYKMQKDASGVEIRIEYGINSIDRIGSDTVMIYSGTAAYFYDNSFNLKSRLECGTGCEFAWTDTDVFYPQGKDICRYSLTENKLYENIFSKLTGGSFIMTSLSFCGYESRLYFFDGDDLCSFDAKSNGIEKLFSADPAAGFLLADGVIYFSENGGVSAYDICTKQTKAIENLHSVPQGTIGGKMLAWTEEGYELYTKDGEKL